MSVPARREPRDGGGQWKTICYAIDSNARTLRLCVICLVLIIGPPAADAVVAQLVLITYNVPTPIQVCPCSPDSACGGHGHSAGGTSP
jgi:hypothetical protein